MWLTSENKQIKNVIFIAFIVRTSKTIQAMFRNFEQSEEKVIFVLFVVSVN